MFLLSKKKKEVEKPEMVDSHSRQVYDTSSASPSGFSTPKKNRNALGPPEEEEVDGGVWGRRATHTHTRLRAYNHVIKNKKIPFFCALSFIPFFSLCLCACVCREREGYEGGAPGEEQRKKVGICCQCVYRLWVRERERVSGIEKEQVLFSCACVCECVCVWRVGLQETEKFFLIIKQFFFLCLSWGLILGIFHTWRPCHRATLIGYNFFSNPPGAKTQVNHSYSSLLFPRKKTFFFSFLLESVWNCERTERKGGHGKCKAKKAEGARWPKKKNTNVFLSFFQI